MAYRQSSLSKMLQRQSPMYTPRLNRGVGSTLGGESGAEMAGLNARDRRRRRRRRRNIGQWA